MCFWKAVSKHFLNDININPKPLIILSRLSTTFYNVFTIHNKTPFHSTNPQQKSYFKPALPQRAARLLWNSFFFDYFSKTCKIVRFGSYLFHILHISFLFCSKKFTISKKFNYLFQYIIFQFPCQGENPISSFCTNKYLFLVFFWIENPIRKRSVPYKISKFVLF